VRQLRAMSQFQASQKVGVTQVTWSRWENGASRVQRRHWAQLASFLGLEISELHDLVAGNSPDDPSGQVVVPLRSSMIDGLRTTRRQKEELDRQGLRQSFLEGLVGLLQRGERLPNDLLRLVAHELFTDTPLSLEDEILKPR